MVEAILAPDDHADLMKVRFWKYLDHRPIDACNAAFEHAGGTVVGHSAVDSNRYILIRA